MSKRDGDSVALNAIPPRTVFAEVAEGDRIEGQGLVVGRAGIILLLAGSGGCCPLNCKVKAQFNPWAIEGC